MKTEKISRKRGLTSIGINWAKDVERTRLNKTWLNYSGKIALRVLSAIEDTPGMNQRKLAELMGVTPQHISKIVKGQENLTLETIGKLSEALQIELIDFPKFKYS